jgi:uroporphyrinogen-III synthase
MNIVLTRPYDDSFELKKLIESRGENTCFIQPATEIVILTKQLDIPTDSMVIITAINGIRALAKNTDNRKYRVITIGEQSANAARSLGFLNVESAVTGVDMKATKDNLVRYIKEKIGNEHIINHISSDIERLDINKRLKADGYKYNRIELYNSKPVEFSYSFIEGIREQKFQAYSFFSPRSAALFAKQIIASGLESFLHQSVAFCFSHNVILGLSGLNFAGIYIPEVTNYENFVNLIQKSNQL